MIVPKNGDWVICYEKYDQGKVFSVDEKNKTALVDFFIENPDSIGGTGREKIFFSEVKEIVTNPKEIEKLEKELNGEEIFD